MSATENLRVTDFSVSKEVFELRFNESLQALETFPRPADIDKYYESDDYISHTDSNTGLVNKIYQSVKQYMLSKKVRLLFQYNRNLKTVLDVGAGTAAFVKLLQTVNVQAKGVEPSEIARKHAADKGVKLFEKIEQVSGEQFDAITMWHVLEHIPDPKEHLRTCYELLNKDGLLVIAVPNYKSFDAKYYGAFWAAYDVPRHLWHFNQVGMQQILRESGFEVRAIKPMIFDAFYIALLSEKYKNGRSSIFKAFWIGLRSNCKALGNKEYSSLIYMAQKS